MENPYTVTVMPGLEMAIAIISHATYFQTVSLRGIPGQSSPVVFQGVGEGLPMRLTDGTGSTSFILPPQSTEFDMSVTLEFTTVVNGPLELAAINTPPVVIVISNSITEIMIQTEDHIDEDDNDTEVTILLSSD